jgi:hypothetical protein
VRILDTIYPYKKNLKLKPILDGRERKGQFEADTMDPITPSAVLRLLTAEDHHRRKGPGPR